MSVEKSVDIESLKEQYPLQLGANNPMLRTETEPVWSIEKKHKELADALTTLMHHHEGVGLAAPQVGQKIRMAAITQWDFEKGRQELLLEEVIINPKLIGSSDEQEKDLEACLSLPGMEWEVIRPKKISVKYTNIDGDEKILKAQGYNARIILHEMDHLDGVLFIDKTIQ